MKTTLISAVSAAAMLCAVPAFAQSSSTHMDRLSSADQQFIKDVGPANQTEIDLGKLASQKGRNETVKEFGRWMESAHGTAGRLLTAITERINSEAPPTTLTSMQQSEQTKLQGLTGDEFDRQYLQMMVDDHQRAIQLFQKETEDGQNRAVKTFAQDLLPALQEHLAETQDLSHDLFNVGNGSGMAANNAAQNAASPNATVAKK